MTEVAVPAKLIVYACPVGKLADQVAAFYDKSLTDVGRNSAHDYMAHFTLVGFFHDDLASIPIYVEVLKAALERARPAQPKTIVEIGEFVFQDHFHGLCVNSPWLEGLTDDFVRSAASPTIRDGLRLKSGYHVSFAYGFRASQATALERLAREMIDPHAPVRWELRLYQQHPDKSWTRHASWPLD
jgi:ubiquitin-associated SH3 domain-containing protein